MMNFPEHEKRYVAINSKCAILYRLCKLFKDVWLTILSTLVRKISFSFLFVKAILTQERALQHQHKNYLIFL